VGCSLVVHFCCLLETVFCGWGVLVYCVCVNRGPIVTIHVRCETFLFVWVGSVRYVESRGRGGLLCWLGLFLGAVIGRVHCKFVGYGRWRVGGCGWFWSLVG